MDRRRLLLILAVFVAIIGTALVFLYVKGADNRASDKFANVSVLKATQDISAGESYDSALAAGKISLQPVPQNQLNAGYQTTTTGLKGQFAAVKIFTGQQIIAAQFGQNSQIEASSPLPIPKGMIAISVNLTDPDRVAGNILDGSHVVIFVTDAGGPDKPSPVDGGTTETATLLKDVLVLNVGSPVATTETTTDETGAATSETLPRTLLTLAVTQQEAQKVIFSSKHATLTFGLLTPTSKIKLRMPGTVYTNLFKVS